MFGLLAVPVSIILCVTAALAYVIGPLTVAPLPLRNGGEEAVIYCVMMIYFALAGAGTWSVDGLLNRNRRRDADVASTA